TDGPPIDGLRILLPPRPLSSEILRSPPSFTPVVACPPSPAVMLPASPPALTVFVLSPVLPPWPPRPADDFPNNEPSSLLTTFPPDAPLSAVSRSKMEPRPRERPPIDGLRMLLPPSPLSSEILMRALPEPPDET